MHAKRPFAIVRPSWRALQALTLASVLLCVVVVYVVTWNNSDAIGSYLPDSLSQVASLGGLVAGAGAGADSVESGETESDTQTGHPIEQLMKSAQKRFDALIGTEATGLEDAAAKYRERRGRHPPPGFAAWYAYAAEHGALVVEAFWDQIYDDLAPLWGVQAHVLRRTAHAFSPTISIRKGVVNAEKKASYERLEGVLQMLDTLARHSHVQLPDIDVPVNVAEEPGMLVPWEAVDTALSLTRAMLTSPEDVIDELAVIEKEEYDGAKFDPEWLDGRLRRTSGMYLGPRPFWSLLQPACAPDSPARTEPIMTSIWDKEGRTKDEHLAGALLPLEGPKGGLRGYVKNWTVATDACRSPHLQGLHGAFVAPESMSVTQKLFPLFSSAKMSMSNEILIPSPSDWTVSDYPNNAPIPWVERENKLFWRGPATGGINTAHNWRRFQRHRFVAMLNATHVEIAEGFLHAGNASSIGLGYGRNFRLLPANPYQLDVQKGGKTAEWVNTWADAAFTDLHCEELTEDGTCDYTNEYFSVDVKSSQEDEARAKYAAAIDGNGDDGSGPSFLDSLRAGKVTLRASVYKNWYDSRMIPWLHYIPLDNTFVDLYGVMEYFVGTSTRAGAEQFPHAHVEVEKHEHHFQTPEGEDERIHEGHAIDHEKDSHESQGMVERDVHTAGGHDKQAQKIAQAAKQWADKVLRKEDVMIYMYRLLLEYARLLDDRRERLGWVEDLVGGGENGRRGT